MNCPQCGKKPKNHDDYACDFRYFHDTVNHEKGWIPSDCIHQWKEQPGEPPVDVCISCGEVRE